MTDEQLLSLIPLPSPAREELEKCGKPIKPFLGMGSVELHRQMLVGVKALRILACECANFPSVSELSKQEKQIRAAGKAILALPPQFKEIYGGIGQHLLAEAKKVQTKIDSLPEKGPGRPSELGKLRFIYDCSTFLHDFGLVPYLVGGDQDSMEYIGFNRKPPKWVIAFARAIWEDERLGSTTMKNWETLVAGSWESWLQFPACLSGIRWNWKLIAEDREIE